MFALYIAEKKFQRHSGYQRTTVLHFRQLVWRIRAGKHLLTVFGKGKIKSQLFLFFLYKFKQKVNST